MPVRAGAGGGEGGAVTAVRRGARVTAMSLEDRAFCQGVLWGLTMVVGLIRAYKLGER